MDAWTVNGWTYESTYEDGRWDHVAVKGNERRNIHHTGRQPMLSGAFRAHVLLNFPDAPRVKTIHGGSGVFAWRNDSIIKAAHEKGVCL